MRLNDDGGLVLGDFFGAGGGGADLTVWVQTAAGTASFAASEVRSAGADHVNFEVPVSARAIVGGIGAGDRFVLALTRPISEPAQELAGRELSEELSRRESAQELAGRDVSGAADGGDVQGLVLAGAAIWGSGLSGGTGFVGYSAPPEPGGPARAGSLAVRYWDGVKVRVPSDLYALAQMEGVVSGGPAGGLTDPVALRLGGSVDLGSGFVLDVGGRSLFSEAATRPDGETVGTAFRYWMWDAPCALWQVGGQAELRIIALEPGDPRHGAHTDASLSGLAFDGADLDAVFDPTAAHHTAVAPADAEHITVDAAANPYACGTQISPADADPHAAGHQIDLGAPGSDTTVTVTVTAADNATTRSYAIDVARAVSFDDTALSALAIDGIELSPGFDPEVADYNAEADADAGRVTVSAETVHLEATAVIAPDDADGNLSNGHQVALGNDGASITVSVTAQDGSAVRFYSITVGRDGVQPARSGRLAGITVGGEDIDFAPGRHRFAATADAGSTTMEFEAAGESVVKGFVLSAGGSEFVPVGYDGVVEMTPGRDTLVAVRASAPGYQRQNLYTVRLRAPEVGSDQQGSQSRTPPPPPPLGSHRQEHAHRRGAGRFVGAQRRPAGNAPHGPERR